MSDKPVLPFSRPSIGEEEYAEVAAVLASGWLTTGSRVREFERLIGELVGSKHVVAMSSCTAALHTSLVAMDIEPGSEVITTPLTFIATSNVILHAGAKPVFADIDYETGNIDTKAVAAQVTPRTSAIIPVHYAGQPCDMAELRELASKHKLHVIEDSAHAIGAEYRGRQIGGDAESACFSFYPNKNITTGEGGAVACNDDAFAKRLRMLISHGLNLDAWHRYTDRNSWYYEVSLPGFKYNMTDVQAAIGIGQIKRLKSFIERRTAIAQRYEVAFAGLPGITTPINRPDRRVAWHLYVLRLGEGARMGRDEFVNVLRGKYNICSTVNFIPIPMHPYYRDTLKYRIEDTPLALRFFKECVSLPLFPGMTDDDVERVVDAVTELLG